MAAQITQYILFAAFALAMAYAAASDLVTMTISNKLTFGLVVGFVAVAPFTGMDWRAFAMHWAAGGAVLAVTFFCFAMGWIGGGDAKLAAAIALWLGWSSAIEFIGIASLLGGALTLILLAFRRSVVPVFIIRQPWVQRLHDDKAGVPYGIALAIAGLATYPHSIWMRVAVG
jgi:prepilin peptidase CpaA